MKATEIICNSKAEQSQDINNKWADLVADQNACNPKPLSKGDSRASEFHLQQENQNIGDTIPGISTRPRVDDPGFGGGHIATGKVKDPGYGGGHLEFTPIPGFSPTPKTTGKGNAY